MDELKDPNKRFVHRAWVVSVLPPLIFSAVSLSWFARNLPGEVYLGYLQGDQPTYTALGRAVVQRGNGLTYANPFDGDIDAPRVLTNLGYGILGWLFRLTGFRTVLVWEVWRVAFGTLMAGLLALLVARLVTASTIRWWAFLVGAFGAGASWILLTGRLLWGPSGSPGWLAEFSEVEKGYGWWCLNQFRQSLYPLELLYHALFLSAILLYLSRRRFGLFLVIVALWWTHPITAILITTIVAGGLLMDSYREGLRQDRIALVSALGVALVFSAYYKLYLPSFPSIRMWIEQTLGFVPVMSVRDWLPAYGVLLIAVPLVFLYGPLRRWATQERDGRLLMIWGVAVLLWTNNHRFLPTPIQPMHFARGHVFLFLVLAAAKGMDLLVAQPGGKRWARRLGTIVLCCVPLFVVDNVLFVGRVALEVPQPGVLTIRREALDVLDSFRQQPGSLLFYSYDQPLGRLIVAHTNHRAYASESFLTPGFTGRIAFLHPVLKKGDTEKLRSIGMDRVVFVKEPGQSLPEWTRNSTDYRVVLENDRYEVGEILTSPER